MVESMRFTGGERGCFGFWRMKRSKKIADMVEFAKTILDAGSAVSFLASG